MHPEYPVVLRCGCGCVPRAPHDDGVLAGLHARTTGAAFEQAQAYGRSLAGPAAVRCALEEDSRPARQVA
jgi:hypothetical protein